MSIKIQSKDLPLELSFDNGVTWKELICLTNYTSNLSATTTDTETLTCGRLVSPGTPAFDFSGEAVCDLEPAAGQVSLRDLETVLLAQTTILARQQYNTNGSIGSLYYKRGEVVVESANNKPTPNDYVKFDFSLKGTGLPVIVNS